MKKILVFVLFLICIILFGVFKYHSLLKEEVNNENFTNFTNNKLDKVKNFPENNFYYNIVSLKNKNLTIIELDKIISSSNSNFIKEPAILIKSEKLLLNKKYKEALNIINSKKWLYYKPFSSLLKGDIFKEMNENQLAASEYMIAYNSFNDKEYKIISLMKLKKLQ